MEFEQVYLARHGQTEWNRLGRKQGRLDSPLTSEGLGHAAALAETASTFKVDGVLVSPLGRARSTAAIVADRLGLGVVVVDELAELDHGQMSGLTTAEVEQRFPGELGRRSQAKYLWRFPAGESYADADARAGRALARGRDLGLRTPLIVSHEMIGRMLLRNLINCDPGRVLGTRQPHHIVVQVEPRTASIRRFTTVTL